MPRDGHTLHPATVHFPIAFLLLAFALDIAHQLPFLVSVPFLGPILNDINIPKASYYILSCGLIAAIPATATGGMELIAMVQRQDLVNKLSKSPDKLATLKNIHPKLKMAFVHALSNDAVMVGSALSWWARKPAAGYAVDAKIAMMSVVFGLVILGSAYLGAALIFEHGVGMVQTKGQAKEK